MQCLHYTDIDECEDDSTLCEQMCNNTIGGYDCSCQEGYQPLEGTGQCEGMYQVIEQAVTVVTIVPLL